VGIVADALAALDVERLLLGVPDRCFPGDPDADAGAGAPDSPAGRRFLEWVRGLGFTGIQLGPQGETSDGDASPYDGTMFARGPLALAVGRLAEAEWGGLIPPDTPDRLARGRPSGDPERIAYAYALGAHRAVLRDAYAAFVARPSAAATRLADFRHAAQEWLERDAREAADPDAHAFAQLVLHAQHASMRAHAARLGLEVWGDLQVGVSERDARSWRGLFLPGYRLGAPPSRTNPEGQPWGYPVLDPGQPDAVLRFAACRFAKTFDEYDGVRIDHPHGLVCPWVYAADTGDDGAAIRAGARLYDSPDLGDHPALARHAIARRDQLNPDRATPRHADDWVTTLEPAQVARYARLVDALLDAARRHGRDARSLACEVLSTCPYPLARVLERHGLGRFRVTQKARADEPRDGYRTEHACPEDWVMVGTHDTPPVWTLVETWRRAGSLGERAAYLAAHLVLDAAARPAFAARLAASPGLLVHAEFADLFASPARQVAVFFVDAFGFREPYNRPGTIDPRNWTLRLAPDHVARYRVRLRDDMALNLPLALAIALRARGAAGGAERAALALRLEREARAWRADGPPA
jgi:4-alpha-glucanotransferase